MRKGHARFSRSLALLVLFLFAALPLAAQNGTPTGPEPPQKSPPAQTASPLSRGHDTTSGEATRLQGINSTDRDDAPIVTVDSRVMFFNSTRYGDRPWAHKNRNRYDDDIYFASRAPEGSTGDFWMTPGNFTAVNTSEDDGIAAISPSGNVIYFLSLRHGWENSGGPFYQAKRDADKVSEIKGLGGGITEFFRSVPLSLIRVYGASLSPDGKAFYFATTVHATTNDHEIWVSRRENVEGEWGYPQNLGPRVNAGGGSYAPFIAADGKTLYFSSGRPGGLGGDDIYMTTMVDGNWRQPVNLGTPINSDADDAFLSIPASGDRVYFSSSRSGNSDIFLAPLAAEFRPSDVLLLSGTTSDSASHKPLEATITVVDLQTGAQVFQGRSNAFDGHFATVLRPGQSYEISVTNPGYIFQSERYTVPSDASYKEVVKNYLLVKAALNQTIILHNVNFDYKSAELKPESHSELDRLVGFMKDLPDMVIELGGHSDNMGTEEFNLHLSLDRANSVKEYLVKTGRIEPTRIVTRGFGTTHPVASNDTDEGRLLNRRVEFTIRAPMVK
jgi:outer membrane protein OmpA-like peptidoglycan-associated protein